MGKKPRYFVIFVYIKRWEAEENKKKIVIMKKAPDWLQLPKNKIGFSKP